MVQSCGVLTEASVTPSSPSLAIPVGMQLTKVEAGPRDMEKANMQSHTDHNGRGTAGVLKRV